MNVKQLYFDFLEKQGAKEKIQAIIRKDIDEWKKHQAYYYEPNDNEPGDYSGHCHMMGDKTIGDIAKTDIEVLKAYTGDSEATYTSGCGLRWLRVADRVTSDIDDCLSIFKGQFIKLFEHIFSVQYFIRGRSNDDHLNSRKEVLFHILLLDHLCSVLITSLFPIITLNLCSLLGGGEFA
jgi:hypothetical protein